MDVSEETRHRSSIRGRRDASLGRRLWRQTEMTRKNSPVASFGSMACILPSSRTMKDRRRSSVTLLLITSLPLWGADASASSECGLSAADRRVTSSLACLACHDGSVQGPIPIGSGHTRPRRDAHPVGMLYEGARRMKLRPLASLPPAIVLVEGRVVCTTCHDGEASGRGKLAIEQGPSSRLCLACHAM